MWQGYVRSHPTYGRWYVRLERQPRWVLRLAVAAVLVVFVLPLVLLALGALLVGGVVLVAGMLIARGLAVLAGLLGGTPHEPETRDVRENVRVVDRGG